ncbi:MAG: NUDIX domain-containing protein [Parachlamydiaceae bacterium]
MERHFTACVYIIKEDRVLLIHHKKLNKWLPAGGHLNPNETPAEGARREVREETGLEIEFIKQENVWVDRWNAKSFERPYQCMIEQILPFGEHPAHEHIDFIYLASPNGGEENHNTQEVHDMRWFTLAEVETLKDDDEIYLETKEVIRSFLYAVHHHIPHGFESRADLQ